MLSVALTREHLSVISAVTQEGRLLTGVQDRPYKGTDIVGFLRHLLGHIAGKIVVIWDGAAIHRCRAVKDFLSGGAKGRVHLEALPAYTPEVNPVEGIWGYLKRVELGNVCCRSIEELREELRYAIARLRHRVHVFQGCLAHAGY